MVPLICICFHGAEGVSGWGECQKNSELRDREDVCVLSDRRRASERGRGREGREAGGGGWSRWAGREEASVTDRE